MSSLAKAAYAKQATTITATSNFIFGFVYFFFCINGCKMAKGRLSGAGCGEERDVVKRCPSVLMNYSSRT